MVYLEIFDTAISGKPGVIKFHSRAAGAEIVKERIAHRDSIAADPRNHIHLCHVAVATARRWTDDEIGVVNPIDLDHRPHGQICRGCHGKGRRVLARSTGNCRPERDIDSVSQVYDIQARKDCLVGPSATQRHIALKDIDGSLERSGGISARIQENDAIVAGINGVVDGGRRSTGREGRTNGRPVWYAARNTGVGPISTSTRRYRIGRCRGDEGEGGKRYRKNGFDHAQAHRKNWRCTIVAIGRKKTVAKIGPMSKKFTCETGRSRVATARPVRCSCGGIAQVQTLQIAKSKFPRHLWLARREAAYSLQTWATGPLAFERASH